MRFSVAVCVVAVALVGLCLAEGEDECKPVVVCSDGEEWEFDLRKLRHDPGQEDTLIGKEGGQSYYMNICGEVKTAADDACKGASVCQNALSGSYKNCGLFASQTFLANNVSDPGKGIIVVYSNGDMCSSGTKRSTTIYLDCDESADEPLVMPVEEDSCAYSVHISTKYACGYQGSSDTAALVILLILIFGFLLYFVLGAVYQKVAKGASTPREFIIHNEFWCALPGMIKDGVLFIVHGCKKGDYVTV